ncbi:Nodulation protein 10 [Mycobacteroides abscessus subsp. abscessus]|uniref:acyltransferase family protein n=1 Tax=Mycobacteroides abscessus TaxID=36809 RepID=UPI000927F91E|nr:acyltransferase [Mycobacteroides abscessus]SIK96620.1 Nodulation protein 10 [Mycobacteroides abscessus subsp. abscessus]SLE16303.1 Nodulation protein 10 [Mycobacteroides abscessus subsp. abscessus]
MLGRVFDPRNNALNAWRLVLATSVILWHTWPLTGHEIPPRPITQLLSQVGVDGFFAVSGFLITSSWMRNPQPRSYFTSRGLRILPGLWVCVFITAFAIAPLGVLIQRGSVSELMKSGAPAAYVLNNGLMNVLFYPGIAGTPKNIPWPGVWNGSLWTLAFETGCYIVVALLGISGLLKYRWAIPTAFVLTLTATAVFGFPAFAMSTIPQMVARFAVMFAAGALIYQYQDKIPAKWSLVALSLGLLLLSGLLSNYRVLGAIPLAYLVIASGALLKRLNLRNDLSYGVYIYAFPIQQLLVIMGLATLRVFPFFIVATLVTLSLAAMSWFVVEKRALALKKRLRVEAGTG